MLKDRHDAGISLSKALIPILSSLPLEEKSKLIVIGLPRGGIPVAYEIASFFSIPMDIVYPRKLGAPGNPEFAIGAITESGEKQLNKQAILATGASKNYIEQIAKKEQDTAAKRLKEYRTLLPKQNLYNKIVILVDDGVATGATIEAAISSLKAKGVKKIILSAPVGSIDSIEKLKKNHSINRVVCPLTPPNFMAVGQFYLKFGQTTEEEITKCFINLKNHHST